MRTFLALALALGTSIPAMAQDLHKNDLDAIRAQLKDTALTNGTFDDARQLLEGKGLLGADAQGQFEMQWALEAWDALTKNPLVAGSSGQPQIQADVDESEPNDDIGSADPLEIGDRGLGSIDPAGDFDFWSFSVTEATSLRIAVDTPESSLDPQLTLLDSLGNVIQFDDDGGPGFDSLINQFLPPGDYFAAVNGFGTSTGSYELSVTGGQPAVHVNNRDVVEGFLDADTATYEFTVPMLSDVLLKTQTPTSDLDTLIQLFAADGTLLATDDDGGNGFDSLIAAQLDAGTYYLVAGSFGGTGVGGFLYENIASPAPSAGGSESEPNDDFTTDNEATCCDSLLGSVDPSGDQDKFTLSVDSPSVLTLTVDTPDSTLDPQVRLFDADENELGFDDDGGPGLDSALVIAVPAGDYFVDVRGFSTSTGSYVLAAICEPATATVGSESEPNDDTGSANAVGTGKAYAGSIEVSGDVDVFSFSLGTPTQLSFVVNTNDSGLDSQVRVLDADGNELYFDDDGGPGTDSLLDSLLLPAGDYFVSVNGFSTSTGDYELSLVAPFGITGPATAGTDLTFLIRGRNKDLFFLLYGMSTGEVATKFGNQLILPAQYVLLVSIPPCGNLPLSLDVPEDAGGMTFFTQALVGYPPYDAGRFSNLLQVDVGLGDGG